MKGIRTFKLYIWILLGIALYSCSDEGEKDLNNNKTTPPPPPEVKKEEPKPKVHSSDEYKEEKVDLGLTKEDIQNLMLQESFPMGTDFKKIHDQLNVKGVKPEGGSDELAAQGLTEAKTKVNLAGKPADLELNFKNDSLYSFYYSINENDFNKAERYYKGIQQFYTSKLGPCIEPVSEEETKNIKTCIWNKKAPYAVMTYDINTGQINWGFQSSKP
jgi:hypothetical protein